MKQKIMCFIVSMLVILSTMITSVLITNPVKATTQNPASLPSNPLNMSYVYSWAQKLASVTYTYGKDIPRGRAFGSHGANLAKDWIKAEMNSTTKLNLSDVRQEQIRHINGTLKYYSSIVNLTDFRLTVNNLNFLPQTLSKNESFAIPSGFCPHTHNYSFANVSMKFWNLSKNGTFSDLVNYSFKNITYFTLLNDKEVFVGNVTYLDENASIPNESAQQGRIYIINNSATSQSQLDNLTYASGCIIANQSGKAHYVVNATKCVYGVIEVSSGDSLTMKNLSKNYSHVIVAKENNNLVLYYNITEGSLIHQKPYFVIVDRIPTHYERRKWFHQNHSAIMDYTTKFKYKNIGVYLIQFLSHKCVAFILYSSFDQHFMMVPTYIWNLEKNIEDINFEQIATPAIPTFTINKTVGEFLVNHSSTNLSGYINQTYEEETQTKVGVTAYDIAGYINPLNKNKKAVLSSRLDGMWGETPGDSGCGNAVVLGITKYIKDNNINPKYNLTILYTTGEENGLRGAEYYNDLHKNDQIFEWFVIDELAFNQNDTVQEISIQNATGLNHWPILKALIQDSHYTNRSGYANYNHSGSINGTEQAIFASRNYIKDAICIAKDYYYEWDRYHSTGDNYTEGDSLKYIDRNDLNYSAELAWNITKYFMVNPDCHFKSATYEAASSSSGSIQDSIKTTFSVESTLPNDKVMINATLYDASTELPVNHILMNYTTNGEGIERNITFAMPSNVQEGDYYVTLEVYNSSARINRIADTHYQGTEGYHANDTNTSQIFHLNHYHSLGDIRIGTLSKNVNNVIRGSKFTSIENAMVWNITAYVGGGYNPAPTYQCLIYRVSDGQLIGASYSAYEGTAEWKTFTFPQKPILLKNTLYMLCIWGNSQNAHVYATPQTFANSYQNSSCTFGYPPQHITWDMAVGLNQLSIFCRYTLNLPPQIINVSNSPSTVGFGYNVTINANLTDDYNNTTVKINITYPNHLCGNYTMSHITGNQYRYMFTNTWLVGQYNYTVWAIDNASNVVSSAGHHFNVTANASISIATLKDSYTGNQYINITDPPNPPNNLTLTNRGLTWNTYYNASSGDNILESYQGPVNYQENNGSWTPINNSFYLLSNNHPAYNYGYRIGNTHGLFGVYFKPDISSTWPVAFAYNKSSNPTTDVIRSKLVGVGYLDPQNNWAYHYLQNAQNSQGQTNGNTIIYPGVFTGTDVSWSYRNTELKEAITMSNTTKTLLQNHPPSMYGLNDASSYLVFITKLDYQNLNLYNSSGMLTGNVTVADNGVDFKDVLGQFKCGLPLGEAWERNNESVREKLTYRLVHLNDDTYLLSGLKVSDLNAMMFPVVIDPTLTVYSRSSDGHINKSDSNYNTARTASSGTVSNSASFLSIGQIKDATGPPSKTYSIYRGFVFFNTSSLPSNAYLDSAKLSLYKKDDFSATDFDITIQNGQPTYPHEPMQSSDYNLNYYSGNGGTLNTRNLQNGYNNISLTSLGWINKNGITKLCLRSSRDINNNGPTGNEYVNVYANEQGIGYQPKLTITYRNQSKIKNTGSTNIKGYLLIQVQFYNATQGKWLVDKDTINETSPRAINSGNLLALDTIFNGHVRASDLTHGAGTYRVFTALQDPNGNILRTSSGVELKAWWQFIKT